MSWVKSKNVEVVITVFIVPLVVNVSVGFFLHDKTNCFNVPYYLDVDLLKVTLL